MTSIFITFSCYRRDSLLAKPQARDTFVATLEKVRRWYATYVIGFVVMPEHLHLLLSEPARGRLAVVLQMLKQEVSAGGPRYRVHFTPEGAPSKLAWAGFPRPPSGPPSRRFRPKPGTADFQFGTGPRPSHFVLEPSLSTAII